MATFDLRKNQLSEITFWQRFFIMPFLREWHYYDAAEGVAIKFKILGGRYIVTYIGRPGKKGK